MAKYFPDDPEKEREARNYLRTLRRRVTNRGGIQRYLAKGGPFAGQQILLSASGDGNTAWFCMGDWFGCYVYGGNRKYGIVDSALVEWRNG